MYIDLIPPISLKEIQAEEDAVRQEAEFLTWFEEESKKAQQAAGIAVKPERGHHAKGGRAGGSQRGSRGGAEGGRSRGRGRGNPKASKDKNGSA